MGFNFNYSNDTLQTASSVIVTYRGISLYAMNYTYIDMNMAVPMYYLMKNL